MEHNTVHTVRSVHTHTHTHTHSLHNQHTTAVSLLPYLVSIPKRIVKLVAGAVALVGSARQDAGTPAERRGRGSSGTHTREHGDHALDRTQWRRGFLQERRRCVVLSYASVPMSDQHTAHLRAAVAELPLELLVVVLCRRQTRCQRGVATHQSGTITDQLGGARRGGSSTVYAREEGRSTSEIVTHSQEHTRTHAYI
jgi:hypothetical protein